jgi:hypothetical protein
MANADFVDIPKRSTGARPFVTSLEKRTSCLFGRGMGSLPAESRWLTIFAVRPDVAELRVQPDSAQPRPVIMRRSRC